MIVRPYKAGDEVGIAEAHRQSIAVLCAKDYTPEQIAGWGGERIKPEKYIDSMTKNGERFFVLEENDMIAGFSGWYGQNIQGFYVHPDYTGKGYGRMLFEITEKDFWAHSNKEKCYIDSSLTAYKFYQKMGFMLIGSYIHTIQSGISIEGMKLEKERPQ